MRTIGTEENGRKKTIRLVIGNPIPWVEAHACAREIEPCEAEKFLETNAAHICEVSLAEDSPDGSIRANARWRKATCPYCKEDQPLVHSRWVYVPGWECEDSPVAIPRDGEGCAYRPYDGEVPLPDELEFMPLADGCGLSMPYGDEAPVEPALRELAQRRIPFSEIPFRKTFGACGRFAGTYVCADCGKAFSVAFGSFEPNGQHIGTDTWRTYYVPPRADTEVIVESVAREWLSIEQRDVDGSGRIVFDFASGETFVDDDCLFGLEEWQFDACARRLGRAFSCFGNLDFYPVVHELLPPSIQLGVCSCWGPGSLWSVILHNRLRGYPMRLFEKLDFQKGLRLENLWYAGGLPRQRRDLDSVWGKTGLPDDEPLRRMLLGDLLLLGQVCRLGPLPFSDVEVLTTIFCDPQANELVSCFCFSEAATFGWRALAGKRGEATIIGKALKGSADWAWYVTWALDALTKPVLEAMLEDEGELLGGLSLDELNYDSIERYVRDCQPSCLRVR